MDRNAVILAGLDPVAARILEIGPSYNPIAAKRDGWCTTVVDHTDRAGLVDKYARLGVDVSRIEEVDRIWDGRPLDALLPEEDLGSYDALIASHVIEHLVDPIAFLASADRILAPSGRVLLAVPDLRLCFDCMRPPSTTGQVIAAWREGRTRHAWSAVFDFLAYSAMPSDGAPGWGRGAGPEVRLTNGFDQVRATLEGYRDGGAGEYVDAHGWTFTPASFRLLILELEALGLSRWRVARLVECPGVEFLAFLERPSGPPPHGDELRDQRMLLLRRRWAEMRELADWMLGDDGAAARGPAGPAAAAASPDPLDAAEARLRRAGALLSGLRARLGR
jgi:SAM-dependent methyltransferase